MSLDETCARASSPERDAVLALLTDKAIELRNDGGSTLVAVDGIDGAGKTTLANELAERLADRGVTVVRATIDSFHLPRARRWARGRSSPVGFYLDSHDLAAVRRELLEPFRAGPGSEYRTGVFDEPTDSAVDGERGRVARGDVLVFDGIFAQRPELARYFDLAIYLDGRDRVLADRRALVARDLPTGTEAILDHVFGWMGRFERYSAGMRYYHDLVRPDLRADVVIDNNDPAAPAVVTVPAPTGSSPAADAGSVALVALDRWNWRDALAVRVGDDQLRFVASHQPIALVVLAKSQVGAQGADWYPLGVLDPDGAMVGVAALAVTGDRCQLFHLAIDRDHQGRGLGGAALRAVIDRAAELLGCRHIELTVHPGNRVATRLYVKCGFRRTGEERDGEPVLVLDLD